MTLSFVQHLLVACFSSNFKFGFLHVIKTLSVCIRFSHMIVNLLEGKSIQGGAYSTRVVPRMSNPITSNKM